MHDETTPPVIRVTVTHTWDVDADTLAAYVGVTGATVTGWIEWGELNAHLGHDMTLAGEAVMLGGVTDFDLHPAPR